MQDQVQALTLLPSGGVPTTYLSSQQTVAETRVGACAWLAGWPAGRLAGWRAGLVRLLSPDPHLSSSPQPSRTQRCPRALPRSSQAVFLELGKARPTIKLLYVTPEQLVRGERLKGALR